MSPAKHATDPDSGIVRGLSHVQYPVAEAKSDVVAALRIFRIALDNYVKPNYLPPQPEPPKGTMRIVT